MVAQSQCLWNQGWRGQSSRAQKQRGQSLRGQKPRTGDSQCVESCFEFWSVECLAAG
jgi:hypothetical protein